MGSINQYALAYERYGLTEEEIKIVESTQGGRNRKDNLRAVSRATNRRKGASRK